MMLDNLTNELGNALEKDNHYSFLKHSRVESIHVLSVLLSKLGSSVLSLTGKNKNKY